MSHEAHLPLVIHGVTWHGSTEPWVWYDHHGRKL